MNKLAKFCRIITIPTVIFFAFLLISYFSKPEYFKTSADIFIPIAFIGIFPLIAYGIAEITRRLKMQTKDEGRKLQRKLAFIFSLLGYITAFVTSITLNLAIPVKKITSTYFFTAMILAIFNIAHVKASGHAAGIVGPMLLLCHFLGWIYIIPCISIYVASFWSSIYLKRHTIMQFIAGTMCAVIAFLTSISIF